MITNVTPQSAAMATDIRDIKPPMEIPNDWAWVPAALDIFILALALFFFWRWWQRRRAQLAFVPPVPPHVRAKQKLEEALALIAQPKPFVIAVSDAARIYLEERASTARRIVSSAMAGSPFARCALASARMTPIAFG